MAIYSVLDNEAKFIAKIILIAETEVFSKFEVHSIYFFTLKKKFPLKCL